MPLRIFFLPFWVLVRKRWVPVLGQRSLEKSQCQMLSMSRKRAVRETETVTFFLNRASKQAQPVTGASTAAVGWYGRNLPMVTFTGPRTTSGRVLEWGS